MKITFCFLYQNSFWMETQKIYKEVERFIKRMCEVTVYISGYRELENICRALTMLSGIEGRDAIGCEKRKCNCDC